MNTLLYKNGDKHVLKDKEPYVCECGEDIFIPVANLYQNKLRDEIVYTPIEEFYVCLNCKKIL